MISEQMTRLDQIEKKNTNFAGIHSEQINITLSYAIRILSGKGMRKILINRFNLFFFIAIQYGKCFTKCKIQS